VSGINKVQINKQTYFYNSIIKYWIKFNIHPAVLILGVIRATQVIFTEMCTRTSN